MQYAVSNIQYAISNMQQLHEVQKSATLMMEGWVALRGSRQPSGEMSPLRLQLGCIICRTPGDHEIMVMITMMRKMSHLQQQQQPGLPLCPSRLGPSCCNFSLTPPLAPENKDVVGEAFRIYLQFSSTYQHKDVQSWMMEKLVGQNGDSDDVDVYVDR